MVSHECQCSPRALLMLVVRLPRGNPKQPMDEMNNDRYEFALGSLLGACVGDAAGATLEFIGRTPSYEEALRAMAMSGGGYFKLAPGQITDDGELTLSLARALSSSRNFNL